MIETGIIEITPYHRRLCYGCTGGIVLIVANKEVTTKAGDVVVQHGAGYTWHNYTNEAAITIEIMNRLKSITTPL